MQKIASIVALLLVLIACGEDFDAGEFDVSGEWAGRATVVTGTDTANYDFALDLEQAEEDVSGSATVSAGGESVEMQVDGEWDFPSVSLTLSAPEYKDLRFDGAFDVDTLVFPPRHRAGGGDDAGLHLRTPGGLRLPGRHPPDRAHRLARLTSALLPALRMTDRRPEEGLPR